MKTTEYGTPLCPVMHLGWFHDDDDKLVSERIPCDEELFLNVDLNVPLEVGDVVAIKDAVRLSVAGGWRVECLGGHVLARSDGSEYAEDFQWKLVFADD